jgi:hypothetical protein
MAYPVAASPYGPPNPSPAYAGVFIPEVWSAKLVQKYYQQTVLAAIANTDYQGEISDLGDTVHIRQKPDITIRSYDANQALTLERPSSSMVTLTIDKGNYFALILDDVMAVQSDLNLLNMWADDAANRMRISIDQSVLATIYAGIAAANKGATAGAISGNINLGTAGTPVAVDKTNVIDLLVNMAQVLDEQNVPDVGRWVVIPAWMAARLKLSDLKDASLTGDGVSAIRNGRLGMIDRWTIYSSNLLPVASGVTDVIGGVKTGLAFASQFTKVETLRSEHTFGTIFRGLQVWGSKVLSGVDIVGAKVTPAP